MSELLFKREADLREAACAYASERNNANRERLRAAALAYASIANEIDERTGEGKP